VPQERKLATIVFADIMGSTALVREHDAEVARRAMQRTYAGMREVLAEHGGTVEKFIGDAVMAVFGVPTAHDDDAERAVRAAFALQDLLARERLSDVGDLVLRIGIDTGEVVTDIESGDHLATGRAVVSAARLEQAAAPGTILVGALTQQLTRSAIGYGAVRSVDAKGLGTIEAFTAQAATTNRGSRKRGVPGTNAPLIGRAAELRLLGEIRARAIAEGRVQMVTVFGAPGVGKSRLAEEFTSLVESGSVRRGTCLPYGKGITFWPAREIVRDEVGIEPEDMPDDAIRKIRVAVARASGGSSDSEAIGDRLAVVAGVVSPQDALPRIEPSGLAQEFAWGLRRYLEHRAAIAPLTLIFEDIHWADGALLDLIEDLAKSAAAPILILCLTRPELNDSRPEWGRHVPGAASIELRPLSPGETRKLVGHLLSIDALPEGLRQTLLERTEGNPFYVEEFIRLLVESGVVERRDNTWAAVRDSRDLIVPPTLQGLIAARLDRAPPAVKRALQQGAVFGRTFGATALAAMVDVPELEIEALLYEAARRDLAHAVDETAAGDSRSYSFKHILTREVAYAGLSKEDRAELHDRVGRWLERSPSGGDRDLVAYHAEQAFSYAREVRMATVELGTRAFDQLFEASRDPMRADLRASIGFSERALSVGDAIGVSREDRTELALRLARQRARLRSDTSRALELDRALADARHLPPTKEFVRALDDRAFLALNMDEVDLGTHLYDEALAAARLLDDPGALVHASLAAGKIAIATGDWPGQRSRFDEALSLARLRGTPRDVVESLGMLRIVALQSGDATTMCALDAEIDSILPSQSSLDRLESLGRAANTAWILGDNALSMRLCGEVRALASELGRRGAYVWASYELGATLHDNGEDTRAIEVLQEASAGLDRATEHLSREVDAELARAYAAIGSLEKATRAADSLSASTPERDVFGQAILEEARATIAGASGDHDRAERGFMRAVKLMAPTGWQFPANARRVRAGRYFVSRGLAVRARHVLEPARAFYSDPLLWRRRAEVESLLKRCEE
jgi:class 3 adenylate cyclase/tetratricopeptide (TPR) repeat protein